MSDKVELLKLNLQLFAKEGPGGEKTEPATEKKLSDARKEGQVAKSRELGQAFALLALFALITAILNIIALWDNPDKRRRQRNRNYRNRSH